MIVEKLFGRFYWPRVEMQILKVFLGMLWVQVEYLIIVLWAPWMCSGWVFHSDSVLRVMDTYQIRSDHTYIHTYIHFLDIFFFILNIIFQKCTIFIFLKFYFMSKLLYIIENRALSWFLAPYIHFSWDIIHIQTDNYTHTNRQRTHGSRRKHSSRNNAMQRW